MLVHRIASAFVLLAFAACHATAESNALQAVIRGAIDDPDTPFQLEVFCTDEQSRRSLVVFRGAIGVWNDERQVRLLADDRRALLQLLLDAGFTEFEARYGEQEKAEKQEGPVRIICQVSIAIAGREKASVQLLDGEQSPDLLGLAAALLDRIEPRAAGGMAATGLEDGLMKLSDGALAPELLELRLLRLFDDETPASGYIVRIRGGKISRQPYVPGDRVGDVDSRPLDGCAVRGLIDALADARVWDLPRNLRHGGFAELEVAVLGSRHIVSARSGFRSADAETQGRFGQMLERIECFSAECL